MKSGSRIGLVLTAVLALAGPAAADVLVFKDSGNRSRDGEVISFGANGQQIVFKTDTEGERPYPRAAIERIEWTSPDSLLRVAAEIGGTDPSLANDLQGLILARLKSAQEARQANNPGTAYTIYKELWRTLGNPAAGSLLGQELLGRFAEPVRSGLPETGYALARQYAASPQSYPQAKTTLEELISLAEGGTNTPGAASLAYRLELARAAAANRDGATAMSHYQAIVGSPVTPQDVAQASRQELDRLSRETGIPVQGAQAAPPVVAATPAPAPPSAVSAPAMTSTAAVATTAAAAPEPAATPPPGPKWKQILWQVQNSDIVGELKELPSQVAAGEHTGAITAFSIIILVGWVLPYSFLAYRARRGDMFADEYKGSAKKVGLFALVPWARKVAGQKPPKNRCPFCNKGIDNIDAYADLNFYACPHCRENITPIYDMKDYVDHLVAQLEMASKRRDRTGDMGTLIEKDAMLKLVRGVLTLAVRRRASDLHAESDTDSMKIRARIDGIMYELMTLPQSIANAFVSAIKVMSNLDITERRAPQDGKLSVWIDKADVDLRINTSPAGIGERVSIRILTQKTMLSDPTRLGLEGENLEKYERTIHRPHGLVIVTGPSGSGKSTTLFVALNELNTGDKNIVTIEDPIEYHIKGVSQMQVNPGANFTFATGLRSILRQDPDIIMVGEIRDKETAEIAMDAATTGHLVFTTLHTIDGPTSFARMADLGVESRRVSSAVSCVMGQRLIRTICPECQKPCKPMKQDLDALGLSNSTRDIAYMHGAGCDHCMNTGYYGRTGIFEFLMPDDAMREILEANASVSVIRELARKNGYRSMREEGILKIMNGTTTPEEVVRMTS